MISKIMVDGCIQDDVSLIQDVGFLYGVGCFDTLRIANGKPLLFEYHLDRLLRTISFLNLDYNVEILHADLCRWICRLCKIAGKTEAIVNVYITGGDRVSGALSYASGRCLIVCRELPEGKPKKIRIRPELFSRNELNAYKTLAYSKSILEFQNLGKGVDEVLLTTADGVLLEGCFSNVGAIVGRTVLFSDAHYILEGTVQKWLKDVLEDVGFRWQSVPLSLMQIENYDELFLMNSVMGIGVVSEVENYSIRSKDMTSLLSDFYVLKNFDAS